ncbi:MAG: asparagine synthetase B [Candidatus Bathyarchaeota archaeon BA2]|nr:MAG: asparagine synthetase B [Candidatus Bathyarchaeota archaeon BA2]
MGAIAAAVNKRGENAVPKAIAMLKELTHRGVDAHGVATPTSAVTAKSIEEIAVQNISSSVALGHNLSCILPRDRPQPVQGKGFTLAFEGRLFPSTSLPDVDEVMERLGLNPQRNAGQVIERLEGSYAFAIACPNQIIAGRDTLGTIPLYYGENETTCAIASERKALWKLGIKNAKSFPPGHLAVVNGQGFSLKPVKTIAQPPREDVDIETVAKRLQTLLLESTRKRVSDLENVAVAFSGGLDSSLIAVLAEKCGINVQLISVGLENQLEVKFAETAAEKLKLPLHIQIYTVKDVEKVLPRVLWLIEEPNPIKASIAIPFYWTAENASKLGYNVLLAGHGADELFGGYQRYLKEYEQSGVEAVQKATYRDMAMSHEKNFQRDNQACSFHKVELRLPFVDRDVVQFSLSLPPSLKIESAKDRLRKRVLRQVAQNLGMPLFIVNKTKKAVQYATGVNKAIQRLAKKKELTSREYVEKVFQRVYPALEVSK